MANKKNKKNNEKRVLAAALCISVVAIAGSTFAWFTSKDEVTNRLSASAAYDVSIAEDFQPPEDWIPGQTINKDVSAVNTGNVDAFVRMWLEGEMSIFNRTSQDDSVAIPTGTPTALTKTTDQKYLDLNFNYYSTSGDNKIYYKELSTLQRKNPDLNDTSNDEANNQPATFNEVQSMQAGGYLASCPDGANYYFVLEQATTIEAYAASDATTKTVIDLKKGDIVATKGATVSGTVAAYIDNGTKGISTDTSQFYPQTEGVYLFRRNVDLASTANTVDDYEYSGYYYVPATGGKLITDGEHYLALYTDGSATGGSDRSDYTVPNNAVTPATPTEPGKDIVSVTPSENMKFYNAKETVVENSGLTWAYDATGKKLTATYPGADGKVGDDTTTATVNESLDDIVIDVALANIGTGGQTWTAKTADGKTTTFYYNDDVEAGDTTTKLVDSVKLADATTQHAYLAFDFDLNVFLDSVQVTIDENGKEKTTPVESGGAFTTPPTNGVGASAAAQTADEIADLAWS